MTMTMVATPPMLQWRRRLMIRTRRSHNTYAHLL
jgi:hypothetical protein